MSWLARSLATSLKIPDDSGADDDPDTPSPPPPPPPPPHPAAAEGVKEDLSELSKTLTRQFWGVANFLAPPPGGEASPAAATSPSGFEEAPPEIAGIRSEFAEIGGRFRSGISRISSHKAVSGISKMASNFFASEEEEEEEVEVVEVVGHEEEVDGEEAVKARHGIDEEEEEAGGYDVEEEWEVIGITNEVLAFARNIARHPETWLDFPLLPDEEDSDGLFSYFDMSEAQQEHSYAIEHLAPRLGALRIELCPIHMSEECFWKIYFVLLHPRLSKHDAELLSTPQIVEARAMLLQRLQNRTKLETEYYAIGSRHHKEVDFVTRSEEDPSRDISQTSLCVRQEAASVIPITDYESERHAIQVTEVAAVDGSVIEEQPLTEQPSNDHTNTSKILLENFEDDTDDWFDEEADAAGDITIAIGDEEDISFSDLEEEDDVK